jgi:ribosome-binding ATPase YchF (GTP1/OBG family)
VGYDEFVTNGGCEGGVRSEGKGYVVRDGDVMLFRFNV